MEQSLGPRGARASLAAVGSAVVALSIPVALLEHGAQASGASEVLPLFAAPMGLGARVLLAVVAALLAAALVWLFWGMDDLIGGTKKLQQARRISASFGWEALIRRVRARSAGARHDPDQALLVRRRRDRHPDAPPRPPLFASRDLPAPDQDISAEIAPRAMPAMPPIEAGLRFDPPRSPAPMSEAEIAGMLAARPAAAADSLCRSATVPDASAVDRPAPIKPEQPLAAPQPVALVETVRTLDLPLIEGADLAALSARFETGMARRQLLRAAGDAQSLLDERLVYARSDASVRTALRTLRPMEAVPDAPRSIAAPAGADEDVEMALDKALATLRRLTEQGRR